MKFIYPIRFFLALFFAVLGYQFATTYFDFADPGLQTAVTGITLIIFAASGVFLVPIISVWLKDWSANFSSRVASEVISQLHLPNIRRRGPSTGGKEKDKAAGFVNPIIVDTSALIDGRIADFVESGFLYGTLIVPRFVLSELHHIADAPDALRRGKGRRGLEILEILKKSKLAKTIIYTAYKDEEKNIDDKILALAKTLKAKILTTDFNLNKVGTVSGIKILNINELVNVLKTTLLPGERIDVKVIQEGKEKTQGVGYLPDGTMIVVENGSGAVGKTVTATVSRVLQTVAGRMIFTQIQDQERAPIGPKTTPN